jgi:hypothetical protein
LACRRLIERWPVDRGEVDVGVDSGDRILAADGGLGAVGEEELHARLGVQQPLRPGALPRRDVGGRHLGRAVARNVARRGAQQLVGLAQAARQLAHHAHRDLGIGTQHLVEGRAVDLQQLAVDQRARARGARQLLEDRHLAEEVALLEHRDLALLLALERLEDLDASVLDDVHLGAEVALAEDVLSAPHFHGEVTGGLLARLLGATRGLEDRLVHRRTSSRSEESNPTRCPKGNVQFGA